uniref:Ig-like domain-containing protein n=1 Tax=Labrus bergylta TaxID=56723 RepID=A0A3Q3FK87_9LABR
MKSNVQLFLFPVICVLFLLVSQSYCSNFGLQFFDYDSLIFHCEGSHDSTGLKIVHRSKGELLKCQTTVTSKRSSCTIPNIFPEDSGQYWCESRDRKRTGDVILESPISVVEGEAVTLRCRHKTTSTNLSADFYKDGCLIRRSSTGNLSIPSVSKRDEGFYKCISGGRESAKSLMAVQDITSQITLCTVCFSVFLYLIFTSETTSSLTLTHEPQLISALFIEHLSYVKSVSP